MHPRRSRHLAPLALLACLAAGCSSSSPSDAPAEQTGAQTGRPTAVAGAGDGEAERARCVVADPEGELLLQVWSVRAPAGGLRLDDVSVAGGLNLEVVAAAAVPFGGTPGTQGVVLDYPPSAGLVDGLARWEERRPLDGLTLRRRDGEHALLVALRLSDPTSLGHLTGTVVVSRTERGTQVTEYSQPLLIKPHDSPCRLDDPAEIADWD